MPRLEPAEPIRLADRNHENYPSCHCTIFKKDGSMTDFKHTQSDPLGSQRNMFSRTLDAPPSKVCSDIFPTPQRAASQTVESSSFQGTQTGYIFNLKEEGSQDILQMKNPLRARVHAQISAAGSSIGVYSFSYSCP